LILNSVILLLSILPIQDLHTEPQDTTILIIWTNPDDTTIDYVQIQMSRDTYPDSLGYPSAIRKISPVHPLETDSIIWYWHLVPGARYYFAVFTVDTNTTPISDTCDTSSSPSPYPPTVEVAYPNRCWTDKNIFKIVFNDTMDSIGVIHSINILSYHNNDTLYNYYADLISRNSYRNPGNYVISDTFTFVVNPYPRSLDTVIVHIKSDFARDIFGWKLDGNYDNIQEGSPDDDAIIPFYFAMLGDFNMDDTVNIQDLNGFSEAILNNDTTCDIGPAYGNVPYLQKEPDGVVNIEDIGVFIQMWTYSIQHFGIKVPEGIITNNDVQCEFNNGEMDIIYNGNKAFTSVEILLEGDIKKFLKGSAFVKDAYTLSEKIGGITVIDIANPVPILKGKLLKVVCNRDTKVWIKVFTQNNEIANAGKVYPKSIVRRASIDTVIVNITGIKRYKIFDITGRMVLNTQTKETHIVIPKGLSPGIYFLKFYYPIETETIKLIKVR